MKIKLLLVALTCLVMAGACSNDKEQTLIYNYGFYEPSAGYAPTDIMILESVFNSNGVVFGQKSFDGTKKEIEQQAKLIFEQSIHKISQDLIETLAADLSRELTLYYGVVSVKDGTYLDKKQYVFKK